MKGERESFDSAERWEVIWGQDGGGHRNRSGCLGGVFRCGLRDLLMEVEKERELSETFLRHLTCRKGLTVVSFVERGRHRKQF